MATATPATIASLVHKPTVKVDPKIAFNNGFRIAERIEDTTVLIALAQIAKA